MSSERKIRANRINARASTGPKSPQGRARVARNALRHGLSLSVQFDPAFSEEIAVLAGEISGPSTNAEIQELATRVAEAQIDLRRARSARHRILSHVLRGLHNEKQVKVASNIVPSALENPQEFVTMLAEGTEQLLAIDRYGKRALARRKFAIRAFERAR